MIYSLDALSLSANTWFSWFHNGFFMEVCNHNPNLLCVYSFFLIFVWLSFYASDCKCSLQPSKNAYLFKFKWICMCSLVGLLFIFHIFRMGANWGLSIFLCTTVVSSPLVLTFQSLFEATVFSCYFKNFCWHAFFGMQARATGAVGYVLTSSFLIRENILALVINHILLCSFSLTHL